MTEETAPKPVLLSIDDDPQVLRAVGRDLRSRYAKRYRILQADSGTAALDALNQLRLREEPVALLLADQRMPGMSGVEMLERAAGIFPDAKRVLLTAYADTDAAIHAINKAGVDYYLLKPWHPPEDGLYPILDDLLEDWEAGYRPSFRGIRVLGHRWSPPTNQVKDFLARNQIPFRWVDVEHNPEGAPLLEQFGATARDLPVVVFPDATHVVNATPELIAGQAGLRAKTETAFYDLVIVGAGPAGLAAAVYGASEGLRTVMIESSAPGGQAGTSSRIENYLGFPSGVSGGDLARRATAQARKFGTEILTPQTASAMRTDGPYRNVCLSDGSELSCHALVVATGVSYRQLDIPGITELSGAGVFYGSAIADAMAYRGEDVFIVGAGNSAGQAAMHLSRHARSVTIILRGDDIRRTMSQYLVDQITETPNIHIRPRTQVMEAHGEGHLEALSLLGPDGAAERVPATALFIFIGATPRTDWLGSAIERDTHGFVLTGPDLPRSGTRPDGWRLDRDPYLLETSVPGVFAVGDVRFGSVKRVASGVGEGAVAISFVHRYLAGA